MSARRGEWLYRASALAALLVSVAHGVSLPLGTTYDGYVYLDLADVLGSARFPADWHVARTPLFPLALKGILWALGRQPGAAISLLTALGLATALVVGAIARALIGPVAGALVIALVACYPTSIAYQHLVLTEVGSSLLLASIVALTLWGGTAGAFLWRRTAALVATLAVAYYWRQSLLSVAPLVAGLHFWSGRSAGGATRRATAIALVQAALIVGLPVAMARPWNRYTDDTGMTAITIRQGLLRQALLPVDHPLVGPHAKRYRQAIADAGNLRSGLRAHVFYGLFGDIFGPGPKDERSARALFLQVVGRNPLGYLKAVGRTFLLYGGATALENENVLHRRMVLDLPSVEGRFDGAPGEKLDRIRGDFGFPARDSRLLRLIRALALPYDRLIVLASLVTLAGFILAFLLRHRLLATLCGIPVFYVIPAAVALASIDRYAFPTHALTLANLVIVPVLVGREIARRRRPSG